MCRSVNLVYQKNVAVKGLDLYRFIVDPLAMASNESHDENNAYCTPAGNCLGDGVLNVSSCMQGAPIILSLPHLNQAAQEYQDAVEGMHPDPELETVLDVHPVSKTRSQNAAYRTRSCKTTPPAFLCYPVWLTRASKVLCYYGS